jgi:hypothetical protein
VAYASPAAAGTAARTLRKYLKGGDWEFRAVTVKEVSGSMLYARYVGEDPTGALEVVTP